MINKFKNKALVLTLFAILSFIFLLILAFVYGKFISDDFNHLKLSEPTEINKFLLIFLVIIYRIATYFFTPLVITLIFAFKQKRGKHRIKLFVRVFLYFVSVILIIHGVLSSLCYLFAVTLRSPSLDSNPFENSEHIAALIGMITIIILRKEIFNNSNDESINNNIFEKKE